MTTLAPALQAYFTERLISQRAASPNTIAGYKQAFRLLLPFASARCGKAPSQLGIDDLDAPAISAFLARLENERGNSPATRNNRLAAVHSMFAYIALYYPEHAATAPAGPRDPRQAHPAHHRHLPHRRRGRRPAGRMRPGNLDRQARPRHARPRPPGRTADLRARLPDPPGHRPDRRRPCSHHRQGKEGTANAARPRGQDSPESLACRAPGSPADPLFPGTTGRRLSRDAIERRLALAVTAATEKCPSLAAKHVTMHTLRHSAAMRLLEAGNDITVIALWLGHEQTSTTNIYLHADMTIKQKAIDKARPPTATPGRYQPPDALLAFLESL